MAFIYEQKHISDWLKGETNSPSSFSRDQITLASGGAALSLTTGMLLGKITTSGKWVQLNPAATDGSQNVSGILYEDTTVPAGVDTQAVAVTRNSVVMDLGLTYPAGITGGQITTAVGQLQSAGILVRRGA